MQAREDDRIRIALQKSGRLSEKSLSLLARSGLHLDLHKDQLFSSCQNFPIDLMLVRDDDIPEYVADGVCDLGVVGLNVLEETRLSGKLDERAPLTTLLNLDFGRCRLSLALPNGAPYSGPESLRGLRIATSYPALLGAYLRDQAVDARVIELSGSVEIAPTLKVADAVCDLVSSGATLRSNGLREVATVLESESMLVRTGRSLPRGRQAALESLLQRFTGVVRAAQSKYIMMNAPRGALDAIRGLLPGMEEPTVMPLGLSGDRVAVHAVSRENIFWETMQELKKVGASSILVLPIEKIID